MKHKRSAGPPVRRSSRNAVRLDLLVFVEGELTEEHYLKDWHRRYRERVNIEIGGFRGPPLQLVHAAAEAMSREKQDEKRGRGRAHDQIWCVFDCDEHPSLPTAFARAREHGIEIAFSNPCLELWFFLHFKDQTAYIDRHAVQNRAQAHLGCSKALTEQALNDLATRYDDARTRAIRLDEKHTADDSPPGSNPSSGVWRLIDQIRGIPAPPAP